MQPIDSSLKAAPVAYAPFNRSLFPLHPRFLAGRSVFRLLAQPENQWTTIRMQQHNKMMLVVNQLTCVVERQVRPVTDYVTGKPVTPHNLNCAEALLLPDGHANTSSPGLIPIRSPGGDSFRFAVRHSAGG